MHLTLEERIGLITHDRAKPAHPHALNGPPSWSATTIGTPYLLFNRVTPDFLSCGAAVTADLNFMASDFALAMWMNLSARPAIFLCRGRDQLDGWYFSITAGNVVAITTNQNLAFQSTTGAGITLNEWTLFSISRTDATAYVFKNGLDTTVTHATHVNPATCNRSMLVGSDGLATHFGGRIAGGPCGPRAWGRALSVEEHRYIFETERHWLGV